jgi:hypothetical protein
MRLAALAVALTLAPSTAFARFAPPEGKPLRYAIVEERGEGVTASRFTTERRVVFHKVSSGFTADLTVTAADATGNEKIAAMSRTVPAALMGRTIRYRLDGEGNVVAVEDQAALIALVAGAFAAMPEVGPGARIAGTIRSMPEAQQRGMLASLLQPMALADRADALAASRAVTVPASSPLGQAVALAGQETVSRDSADRTVIDTVAEGSTGADAPMIRITTRLVIDRATGLLISSERQTESWLPAAPDKRTVSKTTSTVTPVS